jgi:hypothetical protein
VQQEPPGGYTTNVKVLALIRAFDAEIEKCDTNLPKHLAWKKFVGRHLTVTYHVAEPELISNTEA